MMDKLNGYKTYIALALSLLFQALSATHKVNIDPNAAADATNVLYQIAGAVMAGIGIWGRLKATTPGALADPAKAVTDAKATILAAPVSAGGKDGGAAGAGTVTKLIAIVLLVLGSSSALASHKALNVQRDKHGKIARSQTAKHEFRAAHPCPATGRTSGACRGYVIDHVIALKRGGPDKPSNMQWQTIADGKAKDRWE